LALARDLDVMEPKVPEDVYKSHLIGAWAWQGFGVVGLGVEPLRGCCLMMEVADGVCV